jgi:hypothetical protein
MKGRWLVYASNGRSTYRIKGQPAFPRDKELDAI